MKRNKNNSLPLMKRNRLNIRLKCKRKHRKMKKWLKNKLNLIRNKKLNWSNMNLNRHLLKIKYKLRNKSKPIVNQLKINK